MADTISDKLVRLNEVKQQIKQSIIDKGVAVADTDPFSTYPAKIGQIESGGGAPATKFGASVDMWIGDVDANGVLGEPTMKTSLNFAGVKELKNRALDHTFYNRTGITSVDLSSLQSVGAYGMSYTFMTCTYITSVDLSSLQSVSGSFGMQNAFYGCSGIAGHLDLSSLQSVSGSFGMAYTFYRCSRIISVDLSSLQSVGTYGMQNAFYGCSGIISVDLSSLQSVGTSSLESAFSSSGIQTISFPSLTDVQANSFGTSIYNYMFANCTALTEIHFRADMQATIEAMTGYADKWGATNATIFFDL